MLEFRSFTEVQAVFSAISGLESSRLQGGCFGVSGLPLAVPGCVEVQEKEPPAMFTQRS